MDSTPGDSPTPKSIWAAQIGFERVKRIYIYICKFCLSMEQGVDLGGAEEEKGEYGWNSSI